MDAAGGEDRAALTFVGTATTVLRLGGFTVLTDPNFVRRGERVHLGYGLTAKRVMITHLGGTRVLGVLVTMDGAQGADLVELIEPATVVPVHHDDYRVFHSPLEDFVAELRSRGLEGRLRAVARGDTVELAPRAR